MSFKALYDKKRVTKAEKGSQQALMPTLCLKKIPLWIQHNVHAYKYKVICSQITNQT